MDITSYMSCELKVDTKSPGWHKTMTRMLEQIKEVSYTIDAQTGIAYISGRIDPKTLLKLLEKAGKHAQLLRVDSGSYHQNETRRSLANGNEYGYYPQPSDPEPTAPLVLPPPYQPCYEPVFHQQPPAIGQPYYYDGDRQCSIM